MELASAPFKNPEKDYGDRQRAEAAQQRIFPRFPSLQIRQEQQDLPHQRGDGTAGGAQFVQPAFRGSGTGPFPAGYYFVQRFSDVTQLKRENIFIREGQSFLQYKSVKTGQEVILPASKKALDILEKYDYRMNYSSNQQANRELKKICALAGIN